MSHRHPSQSKHEKTVVVSLALAILVAMVQRDSSAEEATPDTSFGQTITPFLTKHCVRCHGEKESEGDVILHGLTAERLAGDDAEIWQRVVEVLTLEEMPPEDEPRPDKAAANRVTQWLQTKLAEAGKESDIDHKLKQPAYANLIRHEKLFDGSQTGPAFSPPRLWRIHPEGYENFLAEFGGELKRAGPLSTPFMAGDGKGLVSNYAALMQADSATLGQLMLNCRQIAQLQTVGFWRMERDRKTKEMVKRHVRKAPESFTSIFYSDAAPTPTQIVAAVADEFELILNRLPSDSEANQYAELLRQSIEIGGKERGLRTMAMAVLLRPEAIYRMEVGLGETDEHGRRMLSPYELANAIAFALTDSSPDQIMLGPEKGRRLQPPSLLDMARDGQLKTREDVRRICLQIWENQLVEKPRIVRFFREFFGYHAAETVFKGDRADKEFATKFLVKDADQLVMHIVENDRDVLKELLTTDRYFVSWPGSLADYEKRIKYITDRIKPGNTKDRNYKYFIERPKSGLHLIPQANPTWRKTVRFYNLDERTWDYPLEQPFPMPEGQRVGLLTHPAWLVAWSGNFGNDPILRGKWIREHLLAGSIPDVPITVDATVPEDPHKTLRQRLEVTRQEYCWKCHQKMEPLSLPFEAYNDFGQYRTEEGLGVTKALKKPKETAPVVTSGQIIDSGDESIDGDVRDVHDLMDRLTKSPRVRQSFVRHAFRYWMGRNESFVDSPTLMAADRAYVESSGSFKQMVLSLLTSDSFLYRK
jgi:hypothetical protein